MTTTSFTPTLSDWPSLAPCPSPLSYHLQTEGQIVSPTASVILTQRKPHPLALSLGCYRTTDCCLAAQGLLLNMHMHTPTHTLCLSLMSLGLRSLSCRSFIDFSRERQKTRNTHTHTHNTDAWYSSKRWPADCEIHLYLNPRLKTSPLLSVLAYAILNYPSRNLYSGLLFSIISPYSLPCLIVAYVWVQHIIQ